MKISKYNMANHIFTKGGRNIMNCFGMREYCMPGNGRKSMCTRFGILLIIIGVIWFLQRAGWLPSGFLGPLVLLLIGAWMLLISRLHGKNPVLGEPDSTVKR
jgi:hypothetical protein